MAHVIKKQPEPGSFARCDLFMKKTAGCYRITNKLNGKAYIGMSMNFLQRERDHFKDSHKGCRKLYAAFKKYGIKNFVFEVIFVQTYGTVSDLAEIEKQLIIDNDSIVSGYNILPASRGRGAYGEEWSAYMKQIYASQELRQKCSQPGNTNPMYGRSRRGEKVGGAVTPLIGENNPMFGRDWRTGKTQKELEDHKKQSVRVGKDNGCYGSTFLWISRDGVYKRHDKNETIPEGWNVGFDKTEAMQKSRCRKVRCITTGTVYNSLTEASKDTGCSNSKISLCCSGKRKQTGNLEWEYEQKKLS